MIIVLDDLNDRALTQNIGHGYIIMVMFTQWDYEYAFSTTLSISAQAHQTQNSIPSSIDQQHRTKNLSSKHDLPHRFTQNPTSTMQPHTHSPPHHHPKPYPHVPADQTPPQAYRFPVPWALRGHDACSRFVFRRLGDHRAICMGGG
jgi:hypothetical protein